MSKKRIEQIPVIQDMFPQYQVVGKLFGGSAARLYILRRGSSEYVLKIANQKGIENGIEKLKNEIFFLETMSQKNETNFSRVVEKKIDEDMVWYMMPYYKSYILLRDFLLENEKSVCNRVLENLFEKVFHYFYSLEVKKSEEDFLLVRNINRVTYRLESSMEMPDEINEVLKMKKMMINGLEYDNYHVIFSTIMKDKKMQEMLSPIYSSLTHDDLTIENVLINAEDEMQYIIIDPRGTSDTGNYRDYVYDLAKFTCTLNGFTTIKYDDFQLLKDNTGYKLLNDSKTQSIYDDYYTAVITIFHEKIQRFYTDDLNWLTRLKFTQACHYLADIPCRLFNGDSVEKTLAMYLKGIILLNECIKNIHLGQENTSLGEKKDELLKI